ncbi:flavin reductase family protein [Novosphingobium terrae]|uniref:flavin reductase family protein n=1 Tax=Novosphingobium terrae TaxID=2726189 RepID=UPI001980105D|nr:flavin reductase family protein [Novosphingobium terrae]
MIAEAIDAAEFRRILGHYPTGVCAVTAMKEGKPKGMVVGSFTSVSLDPPLVAFLPDRRSKSWADIAVAGDFCVNVLSQHQQDVCRALSSRLEDKFENVPYRLSSGGLPIIEGVVAWIACRPYAVHEAGDHDIAVGEVYAMAVEHPHTPLLFLQGGYGSFLPLASIP